MTKFQKSPSFILCGVIAGQKRLARHISPLVTLREKSSINHVPITPDIFNLLTNLKIIRKFC